MSGCHEDRLGAGLLWGLGSGAFRAGAGRGAGFFAGFPGPGSGAPAGRFAPHMVPCSRMYSLMTALPSEPIRPWTGHSA